MIESATALALMLAGGFVCGLGYFRWLWHETHRLTRGERRPAAFAGRALIRFATVLAGVAALLAAGVDGLTLAVGLIGFLGARSVVLSRTRLSAARSSERMSKP